MRFLLSIGLLLLTFSAGSAQDTTAARGYDLVILNGRVIDPETGLDAVRNVAIIGDRIAAISEFPMQGARTIDASGLVVAPGFIDLHAHGQDLSNMRMQAMQGVTTLLELESGLLPIADWYDEKAKHQNPVNYGASAGWTFARIATFSGEGPEATTAYFQKAQSRTDWKQSIASSDQLTQILGLVEQGLKDGGLGIGINAGYAPGYGQKEYFALAELADKYGVATYTHVRYASQLEPQSAFEAVKELIANAELTDAHMHLCHIHSISLADISSTLDLVERARARGINVTVEAYPYGAANTVVGSAAFSVDNWQEKYNITAESFQIGDKRLTDEELADYRANAPGTFVSVHWLDESDPKQLAILDASVTHPDIMIASDATYWSYYDSDSTLVANYEGDEWPLPDGVFGHPRSAGTFSKMLRSYVRERGLLSLSEAIRKMSLMPAQTLEDFVPQMKTKGRLQVGMDADIVVFDPAEVADMATYENANQPAVGVHTVLVNGSLVVDAGELVLDADAGRPIRRQ